MITPQSARMLTRYNQWANHLIFEAVAALPEGEAIKPRPSLFKNMVHTLNHNYVVDLIWQAHLEGRDHGFKARNLVLHDSLPELWRAQQAIDQWYIDWSDRPVGAIARRDRVLPIHRRRARGDEPGRHPAAR